MMTTYDLRPMCDKPILVAGQHCFRVKSPYGWVKVSAIDWRDALTQAAKITPHPVDLQQWDGTRFVSVLDLIQGKTA